MADPLFDPSQPSTDFAAAPSFDPNLPSEDVAPVAEVPIFNPSQTSENQYSLADIKATTPQVLAEDKDFAPIRFSVANEKALQDDPDAQNKVIEAYRIKEARGSTLLEKGKKAATGFIPALTRLVKGAVGAIKTPQDIFLRQAKAITEGKGIEEARKSVGELVAIPTSLESNVAAYLDLGEGLVRAGGGTVTGAARAAVGPGTITEAISSLGKSQLTPEEFRARYFSDLGSAKVATEAAKGQGPALKALGLDAANLAPLGIVVDPVKIEEFSILTDPLNFVPIGAAVGVVGKTGRAIGKNIIARTATEAQAASLAKFMNEAKRVASATSATAQGGVGAGIEAVGDFLTRAGAATQRNFRRAGAGVIGAGVGAILGRDIYSALGGLALTKGLPFVTKVTGKSVSKVGRMVSGVDAVPAPTAFAGEAFKQGAIGTAEGAVLTAPFVIGARTEDEEALLGMIPIAGVARAATLAPAGARAVGEAAQNKLASEIFRTVEQTPAPATAAYGTEPTLDATHAETSSKLDPQEQNFVNLFRSKFEGSPIEIYAVDSKTMAHRTGNESAAGFAIEAGQKTNPDGTTSPIFRILLNESSSALPHEAYHAFEFLEPTRAREFEKSVSDNLTPQQLRNFGDTYDAALNVGKPEAQWTRLTDQGIVREVAAEAFSRIILGQDLSGVPPSVRRQASLFASGLLERLGTPLARTGAAPAAGGSIIGGVRAGTSSVRLGQDWINGLFDRLEQQGELLPTEPFTGTMEQLPVDLSARVPEAPAAPPVRPTQLQLPLSERVPPVQPAPIVEAAAPITPEAQRATVIGAPEALAAAAKLGPEVIARVNELVGYIESGKPVLEIEHSGVKSAGTPEAPLGRTARRAEQEAPDFVREIYEKGVVPDRLVVVGGKPQLLAMSLDKVVTNINRAVKDAATYKVEGLIPYESKEGKLTDAGWREATADLTIYTRNQANGFQGGGDPLVRPATDIGLSIPAETPGYVPTKLTPERANFQNLIQGLATPLTAREVKGQIPGNVKGQVLAEANLRGLEVPAAIRPENITKQQFKSVSRRLMEVNPLRNKLAEAGVPVRELEDVTERINIQNITSMKPRPDLQFNAPVTDIIRGGFSPTPLESTADYGQRILQMDNATFTSTMNASKGGLTGLAYDVGLALKDKNDLTILKGLAETANAAAQSALANKDFAGAMPLIMRGQFFREALEAATNTGSAATMLPRLRPGETSPFSAGDFQPESKPEPEPARPNPHAKGSYNYYVEEKRRQKPNPYAKGSYNYSIEEKRRQGIIIPGQFSPKPGEELSPIKTAAIRTPGGEIFTGAWHGEARMKMADAIGKGELKESIPREEASIEDFGTDGFLTESGEFLNREEAFERAAAVKQIKVAPTETILELESGEFADRRAFAPKSMRDAQGRPLTRDGLVDFEKLYKELAKEREVTKSRTINEAKYAVAPSASKESSLTGWILPSGDFTDLKGSSVHEDYLASNADTLNKRFGTTFPKTPDVDERLAALNKGFVRMRLDRTGNGEEHVEINKRFWNPRNRRTIEARLQDNADEIGSVRVNLLNDAGNVVDSNVIRLANLPEDITPESAIADGLRELRGSAAPFPLAKEVTGRLKQLADNGNVTNEFWINSKTGEILFAPDGHEEAAMEFLPQEKGKYWEDNDAVDEMYRKGFLRGIRGSDSISLNGGFNSGRMDFPKPNISRRAKQTLEVISDSYNNSSVFLDDVNLRINAEPPGDFSPAEANLPGLKLPSEERAAQIVTRRKINRAKERFPEAIVPQFQKNTEGNFIIGDDGKPKPVAIDYDLVDSPVGRSAAKGIRGDEARDDAVANALAAGIVDTYKKAAKNPDIKAGEKWYSTARARLRKIFGEDSKFVTELLAATSARTPVDTNYRFALDAYNNFREGNYDGLLKTYNEGKQKWETRDLADFIEDTGNQNPTRGQFIDWWVEKHDLLPRQSNGKKFGMNSRAVLRVLDGTWRAEVQGPKTPNFAGNLSGDTFDATIDVWAARLLHRLANVGNVKRWRILPQNETGVTDADFNLGQAAFSKAAEELEIKPDALQAILWFAEKDLHEKNGWASGAGAAKSDFNVLLSETETLPTGRKKLRSAQSELGL